MYFSHPTGSFGSGLPYLRRHKYRSTNCATTSQPAGRLSAARRLIAIPGDNWFCCCYPDFQPGAGIPQPMPRSRDRQANVGPCDGSRPVSSAAAVAATVSILDNQTSMGHDEVACYCFYFKTDAAYGRRPVGTRLACGSSARRDSLFLHLQRRPVPACSLQLAYWAPGRFADNSAPRIRRIRLPRRHTVLRAQSMGAKSRSCPKPSTTKTSRDGYLCLAQWRRQLMYEPAQHTRRLQHRQAKTWYATNPDHLGRHWQHQNSRQLYLL